MDPRMRRYPELESLLEQLPGCRLLIDRDYRIVASNDTYRGDCGAGTASPVGRYCYEVSHGYDAPCDQQGESCPRRAAEKTGRADRCVHVHHVPSGTEFVDVEVIPLRDAAHARRTGRSLRGRGPCVPAHARPRQARRRIGYDGAAAG
jgi:two-component system response regulator HydG